MYIEDYKLLALDIVTSLFPVCSGCVTAQFK